MVKIDLHKHESINSPEHWGPSAWYLLHHITRNMVKNNPLLDADETLNSVYQDAMTEYLTTLLLLMPCGICQKNFIDKLDDHHFIDVMGNWKDLDKWGFNLHNSVNKMLEKPGWTFPQYLKQYNRNKPDHKKLLHYPTILQEFHIKPVMCISEIQTMKRYLEAIMVVYPQKSLTLDKIRHRRKDIQAICDYHSLKQYYERWLKSREIASSYKTS